MSTTITRTIDRPAVAQWLEVRKEAGRTIDPEIAEVTWSYELTLDPYGVQPELPLEYQQIGREYFARTPDSNIWVWFGDLPDETVGRLLELHGAKLYFPAGLPSVGECQYPSAPF